MPDSAESPELQPKKSWVWRATLESRAAGKVSVLACVEVVFAVALYWWIAIKWGTHWHLISSVFVAPLLLLRSPESVDQGVRWFLKDWFGFAEYERWSSARRWLWGVVVIVVAGLSTVFFFQWARATLVVGASPEVAIGLWALIFILSAVVAVGSVVVLLGCVAALKAVEMADHLAKSAVVSGAPLGMGLCIRALLCRLGATLQNVPQGLRCLPENWKESSFWVDSFVPAELMPGIREKNDFYAMEGLWSRLRKESSFFMKWLAGPFMGFFFFLPAMLYRVNIKATCWFWWPLAYLLKPVPALNKESQQKQALCWPWENPWQKMLILGPAFLVLVVLICEYFDFSSIQKYRDPSAVPMPMKVFLGMRWVSIAPWHWALLIVEVTGLGMLLIAGNACSHKANGNWEIYANDCMMTHLRMMNVLERARNLATKSFLLFGIGMCLLSFPESQSHLPKTVIDLMGAFYRRNGAGDNS